MTTLYIRQAYLDAIKSGVKSIEGRLAKDKYRLLKVGSTVTFYNDDHTDKVEKKIISLRIYKTFHDAFLKEDYRKAIPDAKTADEAVAAYERFYSAAQQRDRSVIFIEIA